MLATLIGGPYDGEVIDHNDLNLYCEPQFMNHRTFIFLPDPEHWLPLKRDEIDKTQIDRSHCYEMFRENDVVRFEFDHECERFEQAIRLEREGNPNVAPIPYTGKNYFCVRDRCNSDIAGVQGGFVVVDEKDRRWVCCETDSLSMPQQLRPVREAQFSVSEKVTDFASQSYNVEELRRRLSDVLE